VRKRKEGEILGRRIPLAKQEDKKTKGGSGKFPPERRKKKKKGGRKLGNDMLKTTNVSTRDQ